MQPTALSQERKTADNQENSGNEVLDYHWLKSLATSCGADDVGFVEMERAEIQPEAEGISGLLPGAVSIVALLVRMNPDTVCSSWMGVLNREANYVSKKVDDAASLLSHRLLEHGIRNVAVPAAFPMDTQKWPGKMWALSHKTVAEQAGLGRIGHNRLLIHPQFGASVLLSSVVLGRAVSKYDAPPNQTPCSGCKLCVAACPTGAIGPDGTFNFINCATHNYRFRLGGFIDWVETLTKSRNHLEYRRQVSDSETVSTWQGLTYASDFTCLNCLSVCPVGREGQKSPGAVSDGTSPQKLVKRLRERTGSVFVLRGSDAEAHAEKNFPAERIRRVGGGTRPSGARGFLGSLPLVFQPGRSEGLNSVYHFLFTGEDPCHGTVVIRDKTLKVSLELIGKPDVQVISDNRTWMGILAGEQSLLWALMTRRVRVSGSPLLLNGFSKCFPM